MIADNRAVLFIGGGLEAVPGIVKAKSMGLHVVVSDLNPEAPGFGPADGRLVASTYDVEATVDAARHYHRTIQALDGVLCLATDVPYTVASVAKALGLPGMPLEAARLSMDKLAMKERFSEKGVAIPWFAPVAGPAELQQIAAERRHILVVKPVDSRGARGVSRLRRPEDAGWAYAEALRHSPSGRVMVEQYMPGPQVSTESLVIGGVAHTIGVSDRNYEYLDRFAPYVIENGGELPANLEPSVLDKTESLVQAAVSAMGIDRGVAKGDIVVVGGEPHVIEIAARLSGGYFCTHEIPISTGVDFVGLAIRVAMGETPDPAELKPRFQRGVAQRWFFPAPGRVVRIEGEDVVRSQPNIALCEIRVSLGTLVGPVDSHPSRAGVVIATGPDRESAVAAAERAVASVAIETESDCPT